MRVPQVSERIKEAPVHALRGVLSSIGQVLLFTDKLRNKNATDDAAQAAEPASGAVPDSATAASAAQAPVTTQVPVTAATETADPAVVPVPGETAAPTAVKAAPAKARTTSAAKTAAAKTASAKATATPAKTAPVKAKPTPAKASAAPAKTAATRTRKPRPAVGPAPVAPVPVELPLPGYDDLTVASIRARLRNLTVAQISTLADYEQAHAARAEVITTFQRRIAKLEAEG